MNEKGPVPAAPQDALFHIGEVPYVLVVRDGQEYIMAPLERIEGIYYKRLDKAERFPSTQISGISDQCGFIRMSELDGYIDHSAEKEH